MADTLEENYALDDGDNSSINASEAGAEAVSLLDDEPQLHLDDSTLASSAKRGEETTNGSTELSVAEEAARKQNKKRKRKEKERLRKQKRTVLSTEFAQGLGSIATQPPDMQADYLSSKQTAALAKMSELELDEIRLKESVFIDTTMFKLPRIEQNLAEFVHQCLPAVIHQLKDIADATNTKPAHPSLIVLTGNAQRAAHLSRQLRPLARLQETNEALPESASQLPKKPWKKGGSTKDEKPSSGSSSSRSNSSTSTFSVAKLFARHFKLGEHETWLKHHQTPLASGTPQRVAALISSGSLHLDSLQAILIDQTWVDQKQRSVFDTPETRDELVKLLALQPVLAALKKPSGGTRLALF